MERELTVADTTPWTDFEHTGPGTPAGRFMRQFWQPVCRADDLLPGRAKPIRIMSEDFTLYRGTSGTPYVVGARCAHRGTQLSTGWVEDDCIRCFYHGWKYDGSGQCVEQPAEEEGFARKVRIGAYPTREHLGLIFAFIGQGEPPAFPPIPSFEGDGLVETWVDYFPCNFFQCWENSWDPYHVHFTHSTGDTHLGMMPDMPQLTYEETDYGVLERTTTSTGPAGTRPFVMANILRVTVPTANKLQGAGPRMRDSYLIKVPVDDTSHLLFASQHLRMSQEEVEPYLEQHCRYVALRSQHPADDVAAEVLAGRTRMAEVADHPYLAIIEDIVTQAGQGAIADRGAEHLGRSDVGIIAMRKIWSREMRALAEGRPGKSWQPLRSYNPAEALWS